MKIGYVRVSTEEQNTARQEIMLRELGVDELFVDRASGKNADRPELNRMMNFVRRGDTVIVESISRFARNTRDLLDLVERLTEKQVEFVSRKEAIDTTTPTGKFMLTVFAAVAPEVLMRIFTSDPALIESGAVYLRAVSLSYLLCGISQIYLILLKNTGCRRYN